MADQPPKVLVLVVDPRHFDAALKALRGGIKPSSKGRHTIGSRSFRDPDLCEQTERMAAQGFTIDQIAQQLTNTFGKAKAPSRSAIGRYVRNYRLGRLPPRLPVPL